MKNFSKFIICCLVGAAALNLFGSIASAKTLGEIDQEARTKYQSARQQYLNEANFYKTLRQQFLDAKEKYKKLKNAENKAAYEEQARAFLEKTINALIKKLEALKNWVSNRRGISETEKQAIIAEIEQDINWLQEKKSEIATASPTQIKEKVQEIKEHWKDHRISVKKIIGQIWVARLSWTIEKFESVSAKIATKATELKTAGKDTAQLEVLLGDFNQKIAAAKEKKEKAKEKYQAISSLADADQLFKEAHQFIKDANGYLREAHKKLADIIREMKRLGSSETIAE